MNEKSVVLVFQRGYDGKYVLTDTGGVGRESAPSCRYVGEFKIRGKFERHKLMGAHELRDYLDGIKSYRKEELKNLPNIEKGLNFEIEQLEELKKKITPNS